MPSSRTRLVLRGREPLQSNAAGRQAGAEPFPDGKQPPAQPLRVQSQEPAATGSAIPWRMPCRARAGLHQSSNAPIEVSYTQRPGVMHLVIMVHLVWLACAASSLGVRVPCLKHLNIITFCFIELKGLRMSVLIRNPRAMAMASSIALIADTTGPSGRPDNALPIQRRSDSPRAPVGVLPARTRKYRLANQRFWIACSAWPHSANSSCLIWSSPPGPLQRTPAAAAGGKSCEGVLSTWSGSIIVRSALCASNEEFGADRSPVTSSR